MESGECSFLQTPLFQQAATDESDYFIEIRHLKCMGIDREETSQRFSRNQQTHDFRRDLTRFTGMLVGWLFTVKSKFPNQSLKIDLIV